MSRHFSRQRSQLRWFGHVTRMPQERLVRQSWWLYPRESSPDVVQGLSGVILRPWLVPSCCGASGTIWDCWKPWGISSPHKAAAPATLPRGKAVVKKEWMFRIACNVETLTTKNKPLKWSLSSQTLIKMGILYKFFNKNQFCFVLGVGDLKLLLMLPFLRHMWQNILVQRVKKASSPGMPWSDWKMQGANV